MKTAHETADRARIRNERVASQERVRKQQQELLARERHAEVERRDHTVHTVWADPNLTERIIEWLAATRVTDQDASPGDAVAILFTFDVVNRRCHATVRGELPELRDRLIVELPAAVQRACAFCGATTVLGMCRLFAHTPRSPHERTILSDVPPAPKLRYADMTRPADALCLVVSTFKARSGASGDVLEPGTCPWLPTIHSTYVVEDQNHRLYAAGLPDLDTAQIDHLGVHAYRRGGPPAVALLALVDARSSHAPTRQAAAAAGTLLEFCRYERPPVQDLTWLLLRPVSEAGRHGMPVGGVAHQLQLVLDGPAGVIEDARAISMHIHRNVPFSPTGQVWGFRDVHPSSQAYWFAPR